MPYEATSFRCGYLLALKLLITFKNYYIVVFSAFIKKSSNGTLIMLLICIEYLIMFYQT